MVEKLSPDFVKRFFDAYESGRIDYHCRSFNQNPYPSCSNLSLAWQQGYFNREKEIIASQLQLDLEVNHG